LNAEVEVDVNNAENFKVKDAVYLGCFKDASDRALPNSINLAAFNAEAIAVCRLYAEYYDQKIFGLQSGGMCFYGPYNGKYAKHGRGDACNKLCGNSQSGMNCGGEMQSDVYIVSKSQL